MSNIQTYQPPAYSLADMGRMAEAFAKSRLFGVTNPEQALSLMLIAQAEGMHPAIAARDYHVIQGRPSLKADAMLARFQSAGGRVEWHDLSDVKVSATFSHPQGGSARIDWDITRAKTADLGSKDNWRKFPRQMLRARVVSEGIRTVFPGVVVGTYMLEEVQDFDDKPQRTSGPCDMGQANVLENELPDALINHEELAEIYTLIDDSGADMAKFLEAFEINRIEDLSVSKAARARTQLLAKINKKTQANEAHRDPA